MEKNEIEEQEDERENMFAGTVVKKAKHICALTTLFLQRNLYTLCMNSKQTMYIYFITDILDGRDNNKIDIVQYKLRVAYSFFSLAHE